MMGKRCHSVTMSTGSQLWQLLTAVIIVLYIVGFRIILEEFRWNVFENSSLGYRIKVLVFK